MSNRDDCVRIFHVEKNSGKIGLPGDQPIAWPKAEEAPAGRICLGVFPVQRLNACVKALTS
jgi:hypothetical protein